MTLNVTIMNLFICRQNKIEGKGISYVFKLFSSLSRVGIVAELKCIRLLVDVEPHLKNTTYLFFYYLLIISLFNLI